MLTCQVCFSPIITVASPHNASFLKSLGATHVLDRSTSLVSSVQSLTSAPIKTIYDAIAVPETQDPAWELLAPEGVLILSLPPTIDTATIEKGDKAGKRLVFINGLVYDQSQGDLGARFFEHLSEVLDSGEVKPNKVEVLPGGLGRIPEGMERLRLNKVSRTKLIARPQENL